MAYLAHGSMAKISRIGLAVLPTSHNEIQPILRAVSCLNAKQVRGLYFDNKDTPKYPNRKNDTERGGSEEESDSRTKANDQQSIDDILKRTARRNISPTKRLSSMIPKEYWHATGSKSLTDEGHRVGRHSSQEQNEEQSNPNTLDKPVNNTPGEAGTGIPTRHNVVGTWRKSRKSLSPAQRISHLLPDSFWESQATDKVDVIKSAGPLADPSSSPNISVKNHSSEGSHSPSQGLRKRAQVTEGPPAHTLHGYLTAVTRTKKPTYVPSPKVVQTLIDHLDIRPGSTVMEAGSGAGVSTLLLSRKVGNHGRLYSVERDPRCHEVCRQRWMDWYKQCQHGQDRMSETSAVDHVVFVHGRVEDVCGRSEIPSMVDAVYLDVPDVSSALMGVLPVVKLGGVVGIYSPSVSRLTSLLRTVSDRDLPVVLEGVWEGVDKEWRVHQGTGDYQASHPVTHDNDTSFIAKFRKIQSTTSDATQSNPRDNTFEKEDYVLLTSLRQRKKRLQEKVVLKLEPGSEFYNHLGKLRHDDIIGRACGCVLQTSTGRSVYATRATGCERLALSHGIELDYMKAVSHACFLAGVNPGDRVLGLSEKPASFQAIISTITCDDDKRHIDYNSPENPGQQYDKWATNTAHAYTWDAILISSLARNLSSSEVAAFITNLKPQACLAFISYNLLDTHAALGHVNQLDALRFVGLHEVAGREWVLRRAQIPPSTKQACDSQHQEGDELSQYISRPKHGIKNRAVFITIAQKMSP